MDPEFVRNRLQSMSKEDLIAIITSAQNAGIFPNIHRRTLDPQPKEALVNYLLNTPNVHLGNNLIPDYRHVNEARVFRQLKQLATDSFIRRKAMVESATDDQLRTVILSSVNAAIYGYLQGPMGAADVAKMTREQLMRLILKNPRTSLTGHPNDFSVNPNMWIARAHQAEHIQRLIDGLRDPRNEARGAWDGSETGAGKTPSAILTAIGLEVRYILIICPDSVIRKWHLALKDLGLFEYKICTYAGIINARGKGDERWARYKPNPDRLDIIEDMQWLRIRKTNLQGINSLAYDWSALPGTDPQYGVGGCLVIWDEVHNAKGKSKTGVCFNAFTKYLHAEPSKYIRALYLSGTVMEKTEDLPYMMYALGYIAQPSPASQNNFIRTELGDRFRQNLGEDYVPAYDNIQEGKTKLMLYLRLVAMRQKKFSQIPDPLNFLAYRLRLISAPTAEKLNEFIERLLVPNFRQLMQQDWRPDMDQLPSKIKYLRLLDHLAKDPRYANADIESVLAATFDNPITFQGIEVKDEDIAEFMRINKEIEVMLLEVIRGNKRLDGQILGQIQKTLSELEILKLTPFTELARRALNTDLGNGVKGSVVISMLRNSSVRYFAWRMEAILFIEALKATNPTMEYLQNMRIRAVVEIMRRYEQYVESEKLAIATEQALQIKKTFKRYSREELMAMSLEDLIFEYNKWVIYLNVEEFRYVAVFVGNFGNPAPTEFDLESPDENDWIKEGKALSRAIKEEMKEVFQQNQRRVFITNIMISREGIDLHDVSEGGLHPRTGIISPGIVARFLIQMLGRFVREGQTSESIRIVGYIADVKGIPSWEAKFMDKLSSKVKDLQILHKGEISLDILENIDRDGKSILAEIIEEMKMGHQRRDDGRRLNEEAREIGADIAEDNSEVPVATFQPGQAPPAAPVRTVVPPPTSGGRQVTVQMPTGLTDYFQKTLGNRKTATVQVRTPGALLDQAAESPTLLMKVNDTHLLFDLSDKREPMFVAKLIVDVLRKLGLPEMYYREVVRNPAIPSPQDLPPGVIVFRPGFVLNYLSQTQMLAEIEEATRLKVLRENVPEHGLDAYGLLPPIQVDRLLVVFETANSILVGPGYPIESFLPVEMIETKLITVEHREKGVLALHGSTAAVMMAYYSIRTIAFFAAPEIFKSLLVQDPNGVLAGIDKKWKLMNYLQNGQYVIVSSRENMRMLAAMLTTVKSLIAPLQAKQVVDSYVEYADRDLASIIVLPNYREMFSRILDREPDKV
jgi:hypothetical protein